MDHTCPSRTGTWLMLSAAAATAKMASRTGIRELGDYSINLQADEVKLNHSQSPLCDFASLLHSHKTQVFLKSFHNEVLGSMVS